MEIAESSKKIQKLEISQARPSNCMWHIPKKLGCMLHFFFTLTGRELSAWPFGKPIQFPQRLQPRGWQLKVGWCFLNTPARSKNEPADTFDVFPPKWSTIHFSRAMKIRLSKYRRNLGRSRSNGNGDGLMPSAPIIDFPPLNSPFLRRPKKQSSQ